jgi:hypothetical protein
MPDWVKMNTEKNGKWESPCGCVAGRQRATSEWNISIPSLWHYREMEKATGITQYHKELKGGARNGSRTMPG